MLCNDADCSFVSLRADQSKAVQFVLRVYLALESNNWVRFFKLVDSADYMTACLMHLHVRAACAPLLSPCSHLCLFGSSFRPCVWKRCER